MDWNGGSGGGDKGLLWRLPVLKTKDLGKVGPGIGFGAGCGVGFGVGLVGGSGLYIHLLNVSGIGAGFPGLQLGFGFGAGCGIGLGFGYGVGRGVAYDENRRYTNVGKLNQIEILFDELMEITRKMIKATSKEIEKWR
ncbi:hypothetical protein BHE74_00017722 [Ensete ventricosum]|uniref:Uncharacterized protein n=1 Tax=Ensete ventricosum TaxID=4639 RepID=A0A444FIU5_ENSVE|nr:hypothetical protein GW17_00013251 [Ensete ventricosum]RWW74337.1 hypothetical protein BHE74_00017722 [Ensete ventricosum]RZR70918.1 hypothetical protein BHM03_00002327 [Ensete ventricosum]